MKTEFWMCSECSTWFRQPLEIVQVCSGVHLDEFAYGTRIVNDIELRQWCNKCLAHLRRDTNSVLPPPGAIFHNAAYEGYWVCSGAPNRSQIDEARAVLEKVNPNDLPQITIGGYFWTWKKRAT